jgi:hypothetical protein
MGRFGNTRGSTGNRSAGFGNRGGGFGRGQQQDSGRNAPARSHYGQRDSKPEPMLSIGSIVVSKKTIEKHGEEVKEELKNSDMNLVANIYLPKGSNELVLRNGDSLIISFRPMTGKDGKPLMSKNGKPLDFIVGKLLLPSDSN